MLVSKPLTFRISAQSIADAWHCLANHGCRGLRVNSILAFSPVDSLHCRSCVLKHPTSRMSGSRGLIAHPR
eukprot:13336880-Alexandrium_andersonii.AAC.1